MNVRVGKRTRTDYGTTRGRLRPLVGAERAIVLGVRTRTPLATPVVPAPKPTFELERAKSEQRVPLAAPISIVTPLGEFELMQGALLIGRLEECAVCLADPLVSRMHARLIVQGDCVIVEDLHSANGVYLNGVRVVSTAVLREGDRLLMGTTELSLFENRAPSLLRLRMAARVPSDRVESGSDSSAERGPFQAEARPAQPSRLPTVALERSPGPDGSSRNPDSAGPMSSRLRASFERAPATARSTALKMVGALADRLAEGGELEEAAYVVSGQLRRILQGSNAGLLVTPDVATLASHYALAVSRWSGLALWVDYVIELHLSARLLMNEASLHEFAQEAARSPKYDRLLLAYYVDAMRARSQEFSPADLARVVRLAGISEQG